MDDRNQWERRFGGRFEVWEPLGEGAEARLFRVRDRWTGRTSALKVSSGSRALVHEFRLLSRLRHPCLIESQDLVWDGKVAGHLLEYVPAVAPGKLWEAGGEEAVWSAVTQALRGLAYLHRHGYVHGDVAPGNVLVWREGERWRAKVADLGLAALEGEAAGIRGTVGYMAPEVARGEGTVPASDLFGLASTAVAWVDGRGRSEGSSAAEALKRATSGRAVAPPVRRVSVELAGLIERLGRAKPGERSGGEWDSLRERESAWGPPVVQSGVWGLEEPIAGWRSRLEEIPSGRVAALVLRGRYGTGRRTAARSLARELVSEGWSALWEVPLEAMREWLGVREGSPDPVRLARELGRRFEGRDVVAVWPERAGELESRLLRAFTVEREREGTVGRTVVLKPAGLGGDDDASWLEGNLGAAAVSWSGPDRDGLVRVAADLFPIEEPATELPADPMDLASTPVGLLRLKEVRSRAEEPGATDEELLARDVTQLWERVSDRGREVLALLAWSEKGWRWSSLRAALGGRGEVPEPVREALATASLIAQDYGRGELQVRIADQAVRPLLLPLAPEALTAERTAEVAAILAGDPDVHPGDLGLAGSAARRGVAMPEYTARALESAVGAGEYESVLRYWNLLRELDPEAPAPVWRAAATAARMLGRFKEEVAALRGLIAAGPDEQDVFERRLQLVDALVAAGETEEAARVAIALSEESAASERVRLMTRLKHAEMLWQNGKYDEGQAIYEDMRREVPAVPDVEIQYWISRARYSGQTRNPAKMRECLEAAEKAGGEGCERFPLYFHAKAGLLLELDELEGVSRLAARAMKLAEEQGLWNEYVMIALRTAGVQHHLGSAREAGRISSGALATAVGLRNKRMIGMASLFAATGDLVLGRIGPALRRLLYQEREATAAGDQFVLSHCRRLLLHLAAQTGMRGQLERARDALRSTGEPLQNPVSEAEGLWCLFVEDWEGAREHFDSTLDEYTRQGILRGQGAAAARLALALAMLGAPAEAAERLKAAASTLGRCTYPVFEAEMACIRAVVEDRRGDADVSRTCAGLSQERRYLELALWGGVILERARKEDRLRNRAMVLEAVQSLANSVDSKELRREVLSFPPFRRSLGAVRVS